MSTYRTTLAAIAALLFWAVAPTAHAHDEYTWIMVGEAANIYSAGCCGPGDCGVVTNYSADQEVTIATDRDGSELIGAVNDHTRRYQSPDNKMHACVNRFAGHTRCLFLPATAGAQQVPQIIRVAFELYNNQE